MAVHESLDFECADQREIVFDPGGRNAPGRETVESALRETLCLGGVFLGGDDFEIEQGGFNPVRKIFDPGGRNSFLMEVTYSYVNACGTLGGELMLERLLWLIVWLVMYAYILNSCYTGEGEEEG